MRPYNFYAQGLRCEYIYMEFMTCVVVVLPCCSEGSFLAFFRISLGCSVDSCVLFLGVHLYFCT